MPINFATIGVLTKLGDAHEQKQGSRNGRGLHLSFEIFLDHIAADLQDEPIKHDLPYTSKNSHRGRPRSPLTCEGHKNNYK
jgi:hypothetical protein